MRRSCTTITAGRDTGDASCLMRPAAPGEEEGGMKKAGSGDTVKVRFVGKLDDGRVFGVVREQPLEIALGRHDIIPGLEQALTGMGAGESKTVVVQPEQAFGIHDDRLVTTIRRDQLPPDVRPEVGARMRVRPEGGETIDVTVIEVTDSAVRLDANHPLSGKRLLFEIEVVDVL
ncbi:MAG: peptidylprolyl isomerase [Chitinivibrionales bacterium]|nr:peptidylprolyl isomerase [Chitinivibrionales bacterium]